MKSGMPILYDNPKEVGADRIANAVGAFDLYGGPCIVVDLGTATTFDAISAAGEYLGGAIAPGVAISLEALFEHAAALRAGRARRAPRTSSAGRRSSRSSPGTLYGFAAQVDGLCRGSWQELGPSTVVATGGLSALIAPVLERDRARRAVADPPRAAHRLRAQRETERGRRERRRQSPTASSGRTGAARGRRSAVGDLEPARSPATWSRWPAGSCSRGPRASWPSPSCATRRARSSCFALADGDRRLRRVRPAAPRRLDRARPARSCGPSAASCRSRWRTGCCWPRPGAASATSGAASPTSRSATASARSTCGRTSARREMLAAAQRVVQPLRERLWAQGFVEVETPILHPIPGGADGPAVRHPPQRARRRPLPAHRARALPEAARRRRLREGLRDRPGASATRGSRRGTTPSSRCSSSTRPTPTTPT